MEKVRDSDDEGQCTEAKTGGDARADWLREAHIAPAERKQKQTPPRLLNYLPATLEVEMRVQKMFFFSPMTKHISQTYLNKEAIHFNPSATSRPFVV